MKQEAEAAAKTVLYKICQAFNGLGEARRIAWYCNSQRTGNGNEFDSSLAPSSHCRSFHSYRRLSLHTAKLWRTYSCAITYIAKDSFRCFGLTAFTYTHMAGPFLPQLTLSQVEHRDTFNRIWQYQRKECPRSGPAIEDVQTHILVSIFRSGSSLSTGQSVLLGPYQEATRSPFYRLLCQTIQAHSAFRRILHRRLELDALEVGQVLKCVDDLLPLWLRR